MISDEQRKEIAEVARKYSERLESIYEDTIGDLEMRYADLAREEIEEIFGDNL